MRARRAFGVLAVTAALTGSLTACRSQVGIAAFVGPTRITESQVESYLLPELAPTPSAPAGTAAQQADPKQTAGSFLIQQTVYERLLAANGGVPGNAQLAALHDQAFQVQFQATVSGDQADQQVASGLAASGLKPQFLALFLQVIELRQAAINVLKASSPADLAAAFGKLEIPVRMNPRYGQWDASQLAIGSSPAPSWLSTAAPAATS